jgi:hypothetical protein
MHEFSQIIFTKRKIEPSHAYFLAVLFPGGGRAATQFAGLTMTAFTMLKMYNGDHVSFVRASLVDTKVFEF